MRLRLMCAIELDGEAVVEYERMMITDLLSVEICFVKRVHGAKCVEERGNLFFLAANRDLDLLSVCVCVCVCRLEPANMWKSYTFGQWMSELRLSLTAFQIKQANKHLYHRGIYCV